MILYRSTRSREEAIPASRAVLTGIAPDGGLYVPTEIPALPASLKELAELNYRELAFAVMRPFLSDYTEAEVRSCIEAAYDDKFDTPEIAPLAEKNGLYYLELFHGRTLAFKDMALSILPHLLVAAAKKNEVREEIVILTATSGDTGKAALEGFADVEGTRIIVFYPKDGVSRIQEQQMVTQTGDNTDVIAVRGNFDDAQNAVKEIFGDAALKEEMKERGFLFSSANSINIGRLVPQIVYYVWAYTSLMRQGRIAAGDRINVTVPTGNFGNILAAYYARRMGLPIETLLCASNENRVLTDFFGSGIYDKNRPFILTSSPSMDILISSNLERLIFSMEGEDPEKTAALMASLKSEGRYDIPREVMGEIDGFYAGCATESDGAAAIGATYQACGYIMDPHTAVADAVARNWLKETGSSLPMVIASTASPYKFPVPVLSAIGETADEADAFKAIDRLSEVGRMREPAAVTQLRTARRRHEKIADKEALADVIKESLGIATT